ncbi:hypothetical protein [Micromonospora sp. NPDC049102]|uniref:hypothetical protein n=1 Tax=Micromonospora sp. NPDC049102 TaxID=3364265 RepID=UPI003719FCB7
MLPVALTCPLWWVACWTARVLTSLAVLSLALGAAPALLPASTAAAPPPTLWSLALAEPLGPSTAALSTILTDRAVADRAVAGWAARPALSGRAAAQHAGGDPVAGAPADAGPARSVDPQPALKDALAVLPGPPVAGNQARTDAEPSLRAAGPASRASRAPPA